MEFADWQLDQHINYNNPLSKICIRKKGSMKVIEKKINLTELNKEYANVEISIMKQIDSPFVAKYLGHYEDKNQRAIYLYMPFYENGDLEEYLLKNPQLDFKTKMNMFIDILVGLLQLHSKMVIHRDIKLKNIFVDQLGRCVVGDMGIAKITERNAISMLGTVFYQAPEVYSSNEYDQGIDIWAAGILGYQLLNGLREGKVPFPFDEGSPLFKQITGGGNFVSYNDYMQYTSKILPFDPELPQNLVQLIKSMLQNDHKKRITWIELYERGILNDYDQEMRLFSFRADYKQIKNIKEVLSKYHHQIQNMRLQYFDRLNELLSDKNIQLSLQKYPFLLQHKREVHIFFYLQLRRIIAMYQFIRDKKIYQTVISLKPFISKVRDAHYLMERRINYWLHKNQQPDISNNPRYLQNEYREEVKAIVDKFLKGQE